MSEHDIPTDYEKYWTAMWQFQWSKTRIFDGFSATPDEKKEMFDAGLPVLHQVLELLGKHKLYCVTSIDSNNESIEFPEQSRDRLNHHVKVTQEMLESLTVTGLGFSARGKTLLELNDGLEYDVQNAFFFRFNFRDGLIRFQTNVCASSPITSKQRLNPIDSAIRNSDRLEACLEEIEEIPGVWCQSKFIPDDNYYKKEEVAWPYRSGFRLYLPRKVLEEEFEGQDLEKVQRFVWEDRPMGKDLVENVKWERRGNMMFLEQE